jgi:hypothetical protein
VGVFENFKGHLLQNIGQFTLANGLWVKWVSDGLDFWVVHQLFWLLILGYLPSLSYEDDFLFLGYIYKGNFQSHPAEHAINNYQL